MEKIVKLKVLKKNGILVIEHEFKREVPIVEGFEVIKKRKYGKTGLTYLRKK